MNNISNNDKIEIDSLISSFNNLVCDVKSELPIVIYRNDNKFSTYYNYNCQYCCNTHK